MAYYLAFQLHKVGRNHRQVMDEKENLALVLVYYAKVFSRVKTAGQTAALYAQSAAVHLYVIYSATVRLFCHFLILPYSAPT